MGDVETEDFLNTLSSSLSSPAQIPTQLPQAPAPPAPPASDPTNALLDSFTTSPDTVSAVAPSSSDQRWGNLASGFSRGASRLGEAIHLTPQVVGYSLGLTDAPTLAKAAAPVRAAEKKKEGSLSPVAPASWTDPAYWEQQIGGLVPGLGATLVGGMAGTALGSAVAPGPGSAVGAVAGLASAGAWQEYTSSFLDYLDMNGVDTTNEEALTAALSLDPELGSQAKFYAAKRAGVSAVINALGAKIGGKIAEAGLSAPKRIGADVVAGGALMGGGEAAQELVEGKFDPNAVAQASVLGLAGGAPIVMYGGAKFGAKRLTRLVQGEATPPAPPEHVLDPAGRVVPNPAAAIWRERGLDPEYNAANAFVKGIQDTVVELKLDKTHKLVLVSKWIDMLQKKVPTDLWNNSSVGRYFLSQLTNQNPAARHDPETVLQTLAEARTQVQVLPVNGKKNLMPDLLVNDPQTGNSPARISLSQGSDKTLVIDTISRPLTANELTRLLWTANQKIENTYYDHIGWKGEALTGARIKGTRVRTVDISFNGKEDLNTLKISTPQNANAHWIPLSAIVRDPAEVVLDGVEGGKGALRGPDNAPSLSASERAKFTETLGEKYTRKGQDFTPVFSRLARVVSVLAKQMKISKRIEFTPDASPGTDGQAGGYLDKYTLKVSPNTHYSEAHLLETTAHEFGHILLFDHLWTMDTRSLLAILSDYTKWRNEVAKIAHTNPSVEGQAKIAITRAGAMGWLARRGYNPALSGLVPSDVVFNSYWHSFSEWFADNVSRWSTTSLKPLSLVEKEYAGLAQKILRGVSRLYRSAGLKFEAAESLKSYLNTMLDEVDPGAFTTLFHKIAVQSILANQRHLNATGANYVDAIPTTESTEFPREIILKLFSGQDTTRWTRKPPPKGPGGIDLPPDKAGWNVKSGGLIPNLLGMMAHADKINAFYEKTLGIHQLALLNPHIRELSVYKNLIQTAELEKIQHINPRVKRIKQMKRLSAPMRDALITALNDLGDFAFLSADEADKGVRRQPTAAEVDEITQHLSPEARGIFDSVRDDFTQHLSALFDVLRANVRDSGNDLVWQAQRLNELDESWRRLNEAPYVPHVRFGEWAVRVLDPDGKLAHFATTESRKDQARLAAKLEEIYNGKNAKVKLFEVKIGRIAKDALPFLGIPPNILRAIEDKMNLSPSQKEAIHDLQYELAPAKSFLHRLQKRDNVPGYSKDFLRAYADYFLHGANYLVRMKYRNALEAQLKAVFQQAMFMPDGNNRMRVRDMMNEHFADWLDPKPDYWRFKAAAFFIHLGYNIKSAFVNLTQLPIATYPFLARGFSDASAMKYMLQSMGDISTYYSRMSLEKHDEGYLGMLNALVKSGTITEALAPEIAGVAENRNLVNKWLGNAAQRAVSSFMEHSATLFQLTEQMNRRVTAGAAYRLAKDFPTARLVREALDANAEVLSRLIEEGYHPSEARAIVAAKHAVEATQGIYARWARPKMFRGKLGTLFMFKSFQQQTLFMLWNYPATVAKSFLVMGFLGGITGIPLSSDVQDLIKALAWRLFGADFDLERETRKFVIDLADGTVPPDLLLHGVSRYGFGIPALLDLVSGVTGYDIPFPTTDISGSVGFGPVNPVPLSPLFGPVRDANAALGQAAEHGSGAAYSLGFALYKVLTDPTKEQSWLRLVPRAAGNAVRAYEAFNDHVVTQSGARIASFDPRDTEQMMEILALGTGFTPLRLSSSWDRIRAIKEVTTVWDLRREGLLRQYTAATLAKDAEDRTRAINAIRQFNHSLPPEARDKRISTESLAQSLRARQKSVQAQEAGRSISRSDSAIVKSVNALYPETGVIAKKKTKFVQ